MHEFNTDTMQRILNTAAEMQKQWIELYQDKIQSIREYSSIVEETSWIRTPEDALSGVVTVFAVNPSTGERLTIGEIKVSPNAYYPDKNKSLLEYHLSEF